MNNTKFDQLLWKDMIFYIVIGVVILGVISVCLLYICKHMRQELQEDKGAFFALISICVVVLIGSTIFCGKCIGDDLHDIREQSYISYTGEFEIASGYARISATTVLLLPSENMRLSISAYHYQPGSYYGSIVYSEKSKIVLQVSHIDKIE